MPRIEVMANLPKMIFPWIWFEEGADVPDYLVNLLKYTLILLESFILHTHTQNMVKFSFIESINYLIFFSGTKITKFAGYLSFLSLVGAIICFFIYLLVKFEHVKVIEEVIEQRNSHDSKTKSKDLDIIMVEEINSGNQQREKGTSES